MIRPKMRYQHGSWYCYTTDNTVIGKGKSMSAAYLDYLRDIDRHMIVQLAQAAEDARIMQCIRNREGKLPLPATQMKDGFPAGYVPQMDELPEAFYGPSQHKRWWQFWK